MKCLLQAVHYATGLPVEMIERDWRGWRIYHPRRGSNWRRFLRWAENFGFERRRLCSVPVTLRRLALISHRRQVTLIAASWKHAFCIRRGLVIDNGAADPSDLIEDYIIWKEDP